MTETINYSSWCSMLSTLAHHECRGCDCNCHEQGAYGGTNVNPRRPHSFPQGDWARGRRPKGWKGEKLSRQRQRLERLLGIV